MKESSIFRGLDYYSHTCFEFKVESYLLGSTQNTVLAGGRYDALSKYLGHSTELSAVGWAAGIDRLMLLLDEVKNDSLNIGLTYIADRSESTDELMLNLLKTSKYLTSTYLNCKIVVHTYSKSSKNIGK